MEPQNPINPTLIKGLASTNASIRSKNLKIILNYLPTQTLISDDDLKKLWKSLFYSMWHSDKSQNQSYLINRLSNLIPILPPPLSLSYFRHFVITMRREWPGIDHLRLDKFYLLVRCFVRNVFCLLKNLSWDFCVLDEFVRCWENDLLLLNVGDENGGDNVGVNGVAYHFVSVFCDEVKPFLPLSVEALSLLFRPLVSILGRSDNRVLVSKVKSHVFDFLVTCGRAFLEMNKSSGAGDGDERDERVLFGTVALVMEFSTRLYELGSSEECIQSNRKVVLGLHEEFSRLENDMTALGVQVSVPVVAIGDNDDEVPCLVPIADEVGKAKNKKKKSKKKSKKKKNVGSEIGDGSRGEGGDDVNDNVMSEDVISNLQKQFEKIAAESGLEGDGASAMESPSVRANGKVKKRKRTKSAANSDVGGGKDEEDEEAATNTDGKSGKRVRFAMKNNLVWKPHSPLPPQSVRIPPSSTPRGSALKKGVSPGPVRDVTQEVKKAKKKRKPSPLKKARKVKSLSPAAKHGKKVKPMSA